MVFLFLAFHICVAAKNEIFVSLRNFPICSFFCLLEIFQMEEEMFWEIQCKTDDFLFSKGLGCFEQVCC
jgi:hypothetical protein